MASLFGLDIGQAAQAYQAGGLFSVASNLATQRWGSGTPNPVGPVAPVVVQTANLPPMTPPASPAATVGAASSSGAWYSKPIVWIIAAVAVLGAVLLMRKR